MNIINIQDYVHHLNEWRKLFKKPALSLFKHEDRQAIADRIDSELSPENLSCDGELPVLEVRRRYRYLTRCAEELLSIDPNVTFCEYN